MQRSLSEKGNLPVILFLANPTAQTLMYDSVTLKTFYAERYGSHTYSEMYTSGVPVKLLGAASIESSKLWIGTLL